MRSVFDKTTRDKLISRIGMLNSNSIPLWGQMNVFQMVKHCVICEELYHKKIKHKRSFKGRFYGKAALKQILREDVPFPKNAPTSDVFKVKEKHGDIESEKRRWIRLIEEYQNYPDHYVHWYFGKMTKEQLGHFVYKHDDHHLQQFGV